MAFLELETIPKGVVRAVLGSSKGSNGHSYCALGFSRLAEYEVRWVHDNLGGVVPIVNK